LLLVIAAIYPATSGALDYGKDKGLSSVNASFTGESTLDQAGWSVADAGDVNGDGFGDILIGADTNSAGGAKSGQTYIIFGKASGWTMDTSLANAGASFIGEHANDYSGMAVAGAGDVNGDGFDDILICAGGNSEGGGAWAGQVYLIFGKASGWAMDTSLANADASFWGEAANDMMSAAVAGAGDVNGDGYNDILIASANSQAGKGQTYLILGKASGWAKDTSLSKADASFIGEESNQYSGNPLDGAGDVNGDGYDDILIGSPSNDEASNDAGQAYLIFGKATGWAKGTSLSNADASFRGEAAGDQAGNVAGSGDVNGDGFADIIIGANTNDSKAIMAGQTYVIFGKASGWGMDTNLSHADASFDGEHTFDLSGNAVSDAGDVNGDGFDDILIGAFTSSPGGVTSAGKVYLILGKATGWTKHADLASSDASFLGELTNDQAGQSLDIVKDVNGDGYDDVLIAAPNSDAPALDSGQVYLIFPDSNTKPTSVTSVAAYTDSSYANKVDIAQRNDTVFIELKGTDGDPVNRDLALVKARSDLGDARGFRLKLRETGANTGTYRGNLTLRDRTLLEKRWLKVRWTDVVTITSLQDQTKNTSFIVRSVMIKPVQDNGTAYEDSPYSVQYTSAHVLPLVWTYKSNASWLHWDPTAHTISGTPKNGDVRSYYVRINLTHAFMGTDEHNFTLVVKNRPPDLNTSDVPTATEDKLYRVDYNCTDDGQGTVTYHLKTNASGWLSIVPATGVLSGTPRNGDVGRRYVNVSVDDGNGGTDWTNFTLTVINTNDPPVMTGQDVLTATEDALYSVQYSATDPDAGTVLTWALKTNASGWLGINPTTGLLSGTPANADVGKYWVNVTVADQAEGLSSRNFTLTVINTNDVLNITSKPVLTAYSNRPYVYDVNATDVDKGDVLTYSLETKPDGMTIDPVTGLITWTPTEAQVGHRSVNVTITDGKIPVHHNFQINVVSTNHKPVITSPPDATVSVGQTFSYQVAATDADAGDALAYKIDGVPAGMTISPTGMIQWKPTKDQVGEQTITVNVTDGKGFSKASFKVTVKPKKAAPGPNMLLIGIILAVIIAVVVAIVAYMYWRKRSKPEAEAKPVEKPVKEDPYPETAPGNKGTG
jgi:hypothetical protein